MTSDNCNTLLSLDVLSLEDVYWLEDSTARHVLDPKDFGTWSAARQSLPTGKEALQTLKVDLWSAVVKTSKHQDAWTWGGMLVVSVSVCGLVTLAAMTQPSLAPEAKHSLLQYVTGKYLHPPSCKVEWGWEEPQPVGDTMCFTVLCYQRNGQPYPVCDTDDLSVSIAHGTKKITAVMELGSDDPAQAHTARVKFTVRTAGLYVISVLIGGAQAAGGPFRKWFAAGRPAARRSRVGRVPAALLCTAGRARALHVHPRDQFDNPAPLAAGFSIEIRVVGGEVDEKLSSAATFQYDSVNQRVAVEMCFPEPGVYRAAIFYDGVLLHNGEFDCIVLTVVSEPCTSQARPELKLSTPGKMRKQSSKKIELDNFDLCALRNLVNSFYTVRKEIPTLKKILTAAKADLNFPAGEAASVQRASGRRAHAAFEARLLAPGRPRRVLLALSAKHLLLKDYVLKFIPKRIAAFRLCPSTKLTLLPRIGPGPGGEFTLDDGVQPAMRLSSPQRDLIAATFTQLLIANCGGEDSFKNKQEFFYSEMRKAHARYPHEKLSVRVLRAELLRSSLKATRHFTVADWCKNFDVSFQGEQGVDWGGVRREWFSLVCAQLFDAKFGLFVPFRDSPTALVHPNPDRPPHLKLKHFEFAGKLVGKCLYESALGGSYRQLVRARLTRSFLAQIIGLRVHYKYFEQDDPELYLSKIKYILDTDLDAEDALELTFSEDVYDSSGHLVETHDLVPNGSSIRVNNSNKTQYLEALAQWRLAARVRLELAAFLRGLQLLVPHHLLSIFDENELELLVCGTGELCAADWRAHALVAGAGRDWQRRLAWFWAALASLSGEERARLLQFCTGCSQLPPGGFQVSAARTVHTANAAGLVLGRARQSQRRGARAPAAVLHRLLAAAAQRIPAAPTFGALPTAHTCFNQLCLPDYDSYEQMVHALLWAINEGGEGFGMI
ncbi:unnamed protein product [Parnassius apollo]|uniref:(apollo) hypothetical protein n=1 Tax=Parnassius apollo TaxID=110799 RepID=A0A8S3W167_PARAO|nr:unnamed protein product [Parnassius apollo]